MSKPNCAAQPCLSVAQAAWAARVSWGWCGQGSALIITVLDEFEISNLNRQVFAFDHTMNQYKPEATPQIVGRINPKIEIEVHHGDWTDTVDARIERPVIVVNGTDDFSARAGEVGDKRLCIAAAIGLCDGA